MNCEYPKGTHYMCVPFIYPASQEHSNLTLLKSSSPVSCLRPHLPPGRKPGTPCWPHVFPLKSPLPPSHLSLCLCSQHAHDAISESHPTTQALGSGFICFLYSGPSTQSPAWNTDGTNREKEKAPRWEEAKHSVILWGGMCGVDRPWTALHPS